MNYEPVLAKFKIKSRQNGKIQAFCPAHEDKNASLSISLTNDKILLYCFAGCSVDEILKSVKLSYSDLFEPKPTAIYQYRKADGNLSHEKLKYVTPQGKRFTQRRIDGDNIVDNLDGIERIPYNYPNLIKAIKKNEVVLYVEGEKDADTGKLLGYTATTMGGASEWKSDYAKYFKKADLVLIPDKDKAGLNLTQKMVDDLRPVTKSLKTVILPDGKDLTEWVEAGNSDLNSLINKSDDLTPFAGLPNPTITKTLNGYTFDWDNLNVTVRIDRLTDELEGVISVIDKNKKVVVHRSNINLLAPRSLTELANKLKIYYSCDWNTILSQIAIQCGNIVQYVGDCENINAEPITMGIKYLLEPILPLGEPTTIFTSGGKGKSIIADYFATLIQFGVCADNGLNLIPMQANVLYLDWEADKETHRRYITAIKRGFSNEIVANTDDNIRYLHLDHPLTQVADGIKELIVKYDIGFIIIDSQMAATATGTRGLTEAQVASEYYNVLRSFGVTTLTIDHITKQGMIGDNSNDAPYGSVVKYNRSRSQFELKLGDEFDDADIKEYALVHKKFNLGRKLKPMGITATFVNDNNILVSLSFSRCNIADNAKLANTLPPVTRIINSIKHQPLTPAEISEATGINADSVRTYCNRNKNIFKKIGDKWGLLENEMF